MGVIKDCLGRDCRKDFDAIGHSNSAKNIMKKLPYIGTIGVKVPNEKNKEEEKTNNAAFITKEELAMHNSIHDG